MNLDASLNTELETSKVHPKKFLVWLFIIAITMLFAGLTSAYIVRMREGNWFQFELPKQFLYSTFVIVLSSITMWWAYRAAKNDEISQVNAGLITTFILGLGFCYLQFAGWKAMSDQQLFLADDLHGDRVSVSFIYALSFLHLAHMSGGIIFLMVLIFRSFKLNVHRKNLVSIGMCNTYWHFVGIIWIYLYLFFYFAH